MKIEEARLYRYAVKEAHWMIVDLRNRRRKLIAKLRESEPSISVKPPTKTRFVDAATGDVISVAMPRPKGGVSDPTAKAAMSMSEIDCKIKAVDSDLETVIEFYLGCLARATEVMTLRQLSIFYRAHCLNCTVPDAELYDANNAFAEASGLPPIPEYLKPER